MNKSYVNLQYNSKEESNLKTLSHQEMTDLALKIIAKKTELPVNELKISSWLLDGNDIMHVYVNQILNGIVVCNHYASATVTSNGRLIARSFNFDRNTISEHDRNRKYTEKISVAQAYKIAEDLVGIARHDVPAIIVYATKGPQRCVKGYLLQLRDDVKAKWVQVLVNSENGFIEFVTSFYNSYHSFLAVGLPKRNAWFGQNVVSVRKFSEQSEKGWFSTNPISTIGNNAMVTSAGEPLTANSQNHFSADIKLLQNAVYGKNNQKAALLNAFYVFIINNRWLI